MMQSISESTEIQYEWKMIVDMAEHLIASLWNLDVGQWNDCDCGIQ